MREISHLLPIMELMGLDEHVFARLVRPQREQLQSISDGSLHRGTHLLKRAHALKRHMSSFFCLIARRSHCDKIQGTETKRRQVATFLLRTRYCLSCQKAMQ